MNKQRIRSDHTAMRKAAEAMLGESGQRFPLICSLLLALFPVGLYVMLAQCMALLVESSRGQAAWLLSLEDGLFALLMIALSIYVTVPLLIGLIRQGLSVVRGKTVEVSDVFDSFSSRKRYADSLKLAFPFVIKVCLWSALIAMTYELAVFLSGSRAAVALGAFLIVLEAVAAILSLIRCFPVLYFYLYDDRMSPREARKRARARRRTDYRVYLGFWFGYLPHLLLGLVTFGVLLLIWVLPQMTVAYHDLCRALEEQHEQHEIAIGDHKHE